MKKLILLICANLKIGSFLTLFFFFSQSFPSDIQGPFKINPSNSNLFYWKGLSLKGHFFCKIYPLYTKESHGASKQLWTHFTSQNFNKNYPF